MRKMKSRENSLDSKLNTKAAAAAVTTTTTTTSKRYKQTFLLCCANHYSAGTRNSDDFFARIFRRNSGNWAEFIEIGIFQKFLLPFSVFPVYNFIL
jgi:hypothetical protein